MYLETVRKVGKIMTIHFFENIAFEKNLPVLTLKQTHQYDEIFFVFHFLFYTYCVRILKKILEITSKILFPMSRLSVHLLVRACTAMKV